MTRRRLKQIISAAAVAGMALTAMAAPVEAGNAPVEGSRFSIQVFGIDAASVLDGLSLEIFEGAVDPGQNGADVVPVSGCLPGGKHGRNDPAAAYRTEFCDIDDDATYTVGLDGVPEGYNAVAYCSRWGTEVATAPEALGGGSPTFSLEVGEYADCSIIVAPVGATMVYSVVVNGLGHVAALDGVEIEVYQDSVLVDPLTCTASTPAELGSMFSPPTAGFGGTCELPPSAIPLLTEDLSVPYQLGLSELPPGYSIANAYCYSMGYGDDFDLITDPETVEFQVYPGPDGLPTVNCQIYLMGPPTVYVEHVVNGGPADTTDFTTQLFDDGGSMVGESSDPSAEFCEASFPDKQEPRVLGPIYFGPTFAADVCGAIVAAPGENYTVGAVLPDYGYEADIDCDQETPGFNNFLMERVVSDLDTFDHPTSLDDYESLCQLTATYYTQTIEVDVVVDNTLGGSSTGSDIRVEVYDQDGLLVDSGFDPAPNSTSASAEFTLPIGDYTIGASGPAGYTFSATVSVVEIALGEIIDDPSADLTLTSQQTALGEVKAIGQPAPTTNPTTTATGILPPTGATSTTDNIAWWALGLLLAGLAIAGATRRTSRLES